MEVVKWRNINTDKGLADLLLPLIDIIDYNRLK